MIAFHSVLPELAQREVRCVHLGAAPDGEPDSELLAGEYAFVEYYCEDLNCDCRRVFLQVISRGQNDKVLASINYGWEKESFYQKRLAWDSRAARDIVRGSLDPMCEQSEFSAVMLDMFQRIVLDEPYRLRLRRHCKMCREEISKLRLTPQSK